MLIPTSPIEVVGELRITFKGKADPSFITTEAQAMEQMRHILEEFAKNEIVLGDFDTVDGEIDYLHVAVNKSVERAVAEVESGFSHDSTPKTTEKLKSEPISSARKKQPWEYPNYLYNDFDERAAEDSRGF